MTMGIISTKLIDSVCIKYGTQRNACLHACSCFRRNDKHNAENDKHNAENDKHNAQFLIGEKSLF